MLDPELHNYLSGINQNLTEIKNKKSPGIWRSFFNGLFNAMGYVVGLVIMILILGFVLSKTGLLKQFQTQVEQFQSFMQSAQKMMSSSQNYQEQMQKGSVITLPNGEKIQVSQ